MKAPNIGDTVLWRYPGERGRTKQGTTTAVYRNAIHVQTDTGLHAVVMPWAIIGVLRSIPVQSHLLEDNVA